MKIRGWWKIIRCTSLLHFLFGTINRHNNLFDICIWIAWYFKQNLRDGSLPIPTKPLPVFHDRPSHPNCKVQAQPDKESMWYACIHHGLSNVAIYMPCVNMHHAGYYQLEMIFEHVHISPIAMSNILHGSDCLCSKIDIYVANSGLISS